MGEPRKNGRVDSYASQREGWLKRKISSRITVGYLQNVVAFGILKSPEDCGTEKNRIALHVVGLNLLQMPWEPC